MQYVTVVYCDGILINGIKKSVTIHDGYPADSARVQ
jgi:hypothetical protein